MSVRLPNKAHASVFPDVAIPPADLVSFILHNPAAPFAMTPARLKHTAFIDAESGTRLTYAGLIESSIGVARCLFDAGLKRGDVAFVISPNSMHMPTVTFACLRAGMTVSPCNPAYTLREITSQIKDCGAKAIFASESCLSTVVEAAAACGIPKERIILMPTSKDLVAAPTISKEILGLGSFPTLLGLIEKGKTSKAKVQEGWVDRKEGESSGMVAYLCYSSGTTGAAKGVKLSHRNLLSSLLQVHPLDGATDYIPFQTICAGVVPQFHIFGIATVMLRPLLNGCTVVAIPQYSLPTYLSYIQKYKCTFLHVVPPQLLSLAKDPIVTAAHLASVQLLFVAAAPFSPQTVVELQERIGRPVLVKQAWGQTELSPVGTQAPTGTLSLAGKTWIAPAGSCGMVMPNSQIRLVDPDSLEDVELGKEGEIWIKGPQVMLGYLNRPDADKETFVGDWMRTGDIAMFDSEGWLYITDRLKELIKVNAFQVAPSELEALLLTHPAILDCAVIGLPHPRSGQVPKAYVVPKAGQTLRGEEVAKWIEGQVAAYKRLRGGVDVVEAVPKSPSGKILRRVLVDMEKERAAKQEKQAKL